MKKICLVTLFILTIAFLMPTCYAASSASSTLQNIGYIGDYTKCRLTAAQAESYANIIDNISLDDFITGTEHNPKEWLDETYQVNNPQYYAVLADISDDGIPILILFCEIPFADQNIQVLEDFGEHPVFMLIYHLDGVNAAIFRNSMNDSEGGFKAISIVTYKNKSFLYGFTAYSDVSSNYAYLIKAANGTLDYAHSVTHEVLFDPPADNSGGWEENYSVFSRSLIDEEVVEWSSIEAIRETSRGIFTEFNSGGFNFGEEFPGRSKTQRNLVATALKNYAKERATPEITIILNGSVVECEVPPRIIEDRTMVPVRAVTEALGCSVEWEEEDEGISVFMPDGNPLMLMHIGDSMATVHYLDADGNYILDGPYEPIYRAEVDSPPILIENRTFVPLRFIAEAMNFSVEWEERTQTVYLRTGGSHKDKSLTESDAWRLIYRTIFADGSDEEGELKRIESEMAGDVEIFRFEFHPFGDSMTYDSISVNSKTWEITTEQVEYEYAQAMLDYWEKSLPAEMRFARELMKKWRVEDATASDWFYGGEEVEFFSDWTGLERLEGYQKPFTWSIEIIDHKATKDIIPNLDPGQKYQLKMIRDEYDMTYYPIIKDSQLHLHLDAGSPLILTIIK